MSDQQPAAAPLFPGMLVEFLPEPEPEPALNLYLVVAYYTPCGYWSVKGEYCNLEHARAIARELSAGWKRRQIWRIGP